MRQRIRPIQSLEVSKQPGAFLLLLGAKAGMWEGVLKTIFFMIILHTRHRYIFFPSTNASCTLAPGSAGKAINL